MASKDLLQKLVNSNLDFLNQELVPAVNKEYLKTLLTQLIERLKLSVIVLTDENTDNRAQLNELWLSFTSNVEVSNAITQILSEATSKVTDEKIREFLEMLINPLVKTLVAVTDGDKLDSAQIKAIWVDFAETKLILFALSNIDWLVRKLVKDEKVANFIIKILKALGN